MPDTHTHNWGPIQRGRFAGEPNRPCMTDGCTVITLDLYLYCTDCGSEVVTTADEPGIYHHIDSRTDSDHAPMPEAGEAPETEDDGPDNDEWINRAYQSGAVGNERSSR